MSPRPQASILYVMSMNGASSSEPSASTAQILAAERLASALVGTFETCERAGAPLSEVQKIAMVESALLEFDGFEARLEALGALGALLRETTSHSVRSDG